MVSHGAILAGRNRPETASTGPDTLVRVFRGWRLAGRNPTQSGTVPGYHLNAAPIVTAEEGYDLADYDVAPDPSTPYRRFSGADTRFLKFADEAEAKAVLAGYWVNTE